jgi:hypothetical protein
MTPEDEAARELAKLDELAREGLGDMRFFTLRKVVFGIVCGVAAAALVVLILEAHSPRPKAPAPAKPVTVQILPAKP